MCFATDDWGGTSDGSAAGVLRSPKKGNVMKKCLAVAVFAIAALIAGTGASAQQGAPAAQKPAPTITSMLQTQLTIVETEIVGAANAMPEDKYSFAPTNGNFIGVRTFAQEAKHVATINNLFFGSLLGEPTPPGINEGTNGPDDMQTKAQIIQYLKDSFAHGHKAIATINADNAFTVLDHPVLSFLNTRAGVASFAAVHAMDHYGQMVEYLRDNGVVPPASANQPPANPPAKK
jgi:uncharacterized damage-inducible protein DinB